MDPIHLDAREVAAIVDQVLQLAGKQQTVDISDLEIISYIGDNTPDQFSSVQEAVFCGTRIIDAIYYLALPQDKRPLIERVPAETDDIVPTMIEAGRALVYQLFLILARGSPSEIRTSEAGRDVPGFLPKIFGLTESPEYYARLICSFSLFKVDWSFVKYLNFSLLDQKMRNRLSIGVAGYRLITPFKYFLPRGDATVEAIRAYEVVRKIANTTADWSIHPLTKTAACMSYYCSLNGNVGNLILAVFSESDISKMVVAKMLFDRPVFNPSHSAWRSWQVNDMPALNDPIFKE